MFFQCTILTNFTPETEIVFMTNLQIENKDTYAYLVGISEYYDEAMAPALPYVSDHLEALHKVLCDDTRAALSNENISIALNTGRKQINRKLASLSDFLNKQLSTVIFYFSGISVLQTEQGHIYLVPSDASFRYIEDEGISLKSLHTKLKRVKSGRKILILDLFQYTNSQGGQTSFFDELDFMDDLIILINRAPLNYAISGIQNQFSYHLIDILNNGVKNNNPVLTISDLYRKLVQIPELKQTLKLYCPDNLLNTVLAANVAYAGDENSEEEIHWANALKVNTIQAFDQFVERFPRGKYLTLAINIMRKLEEEEEKWHEACRKNMLSAFREYLSLYPEGNFVSEAMFRIKRLKRGRMENSQVQVSSQNVVEDVMLEYEPTETEIKPESQKSKFDDLISSFIKKEGSVSIRNSKIQASREDLSAKAVEETDEIMTESFAKLLVKQKQYGKAVQAYQKLKIRFPERSTEFENLIQELKQQG